MRIGILGSKGIPGNHGVEVVVESLVPHLASLGHDITVYGYDSYTESVDDYCGAKIKTVRGSSNRNIEMISHMWKASLDARRECFDIVHIHSSDPCLLAWVPKAKYGIVATSHGQAYVRKKWGSLAKTMSKIAERLFIYLPDISTSVSKPLTDYYKQKYNRDVLYIPNGIKFRSTPESRFLKKWGLEPEGYLFCSAGRIEKTKGLDTLIQAYRLLKTDLPLIIAGGGSSSDTSYFNQLKKESPPGVNFVGFLTGDEFYSLYAHAKIFVFPSEYEAMSIALLEGLSFGTPTIYSSIPENEAVAAGLGYAFEVSNAESLTEQLIFVQKEYKQAVARGKKALEHIRKNHDWEAIAKRYDEIYKRIANG